MAIEFLRIVTWLLFAIASGFTEALIYHRHVDKPSTSKSLDEHIGYSILRGFMFIGLFMFSQYDIISLICAFIGCILTFPMLHDATYYATRKYYSNGKIYPNGFFTNIPQEGSKLSLSLKIRLSCFLIGLITFIIISFKQS